MSAIRRYWTKDQMLVGPYDEPSTLVEWHWLAFPGQNAVCGGCVVERPDGRWQALLQAEQLGTFDTPEEAMAACETAAWE